MSLAESLGDNPEEVTVIADDGNVNRLSFSNELNWLNYTNCLCIDPDLFFPERGSDVEAAKAVCLGCVVTEHCLGDALLTQAKGIRGGLTEEERRTIYPGGFL